MLCLPSLVKIMQHRTRKAWQASLVLMELLVNIPDVCINGQRRAGVIQEMVKVGTKGGVSVKMVMHVGAINLLKGRC